MPHSMADLRSAKKEVWGRLFGRAVKAHATVRDRPPIHRGVDTLLNIVGVSIGYKRSDGTDSPTPCVRVLVRKKVPRCDLPRSVRVLQRYDGIETDVGQVGNLKFASPTCDIPTARQSRPFACGVSISGQDVAAGSLGYVVRRKNTSQQYLLTNYHVLFPLNQPPSNRPVFQPGGGDALHHPSNKIGVAFEGLPIRLCLEGSTYGNRMDAAIAPVSNDMVTKTICAVGKLRKGISVPNLNTMVWMFGKSSRGIWGAVNQTDVDVIIPVGRTCAVFKNQVHIGPIGRNLRFGSKGDSGSVVVNSNRLACALFFAIDGRGGGYATPISRVLRQFDLVID